MSARKAVASGLAVALTAIILQIVPAAAAGAATHNAVRTWGDNATAQLGNGATTAVSPGTLVEPSSVPALDGVTALAGGGGHSLALANGTVWSWGKDDKGQLGRGLLYNPSPLAPPRLPQGTPGTVAIGTSGVTITAVAAGAAHSLALDSSGTVWAWGDDSSGQLGDADATLLPKTTPVQVRTGAVNGPVLSGIIAIAAGANHSLALKSDGSLWAWGSNTSGQLGNGTYLPSTTAAAVPGILSAITGNVASGVSAIAAGPNHSLAVVGGNVVAWGDNTSGQLGPATTATSNSPIATQVQGISTASRVAGGSGVSFATTTGNKVMSWGSASLIGRTPTTTSPANQPAEVTGLDGTYAVAAHGNHVLALNTTSGAVYSWGANGSGQLGTAGAATNSPTAIPSVTSATIVAVGDSHSLAIVRPRATASSPLAFGNVTIGGGSAKQSITVSNAGPGQLFVDAPVFSAPFSITSNGCSGAVAALSTCTIEVTFTPTSVNSWSFDVSIVSNNFAGPLTVRVTGAGVLPAGQLDITADDAVVPSTPPAVPLGAIPINPQAPDFNRADLPNLRLGDLPNLRLGDLPNLRLGDLPNLRLVDLPNLRLGDLPNLRLVDLSNLRLVDLPNLRLGGLGEAARAILSTITLNQLPIQHPVGGWATVLAGSALAGVPLQSVNILQVISLADADVRTAGITLGDLFQAKGAGSSPFTDVGFLALLLGPTQLRNAPLPDGPNWCQRLEKLGYPSCGASLLGNGHQDALDASPMELALDGVPFGAVNGDGPIPIDQIRFRDMPLIDPQAPVEHLRLDWIDTYATSDLGAIKLSTIPNGETGASNPEVVVDCQRISCTNGTSTLNDASKAGAIKTGATFSQLGRAVDNLTLGNVGYGLLPPDTAGIDAARLRDLGILGYRPGNPTSLPSDIHYHLTFTSTTQDATITSPTVSVTLPDEFTFVPDSTTGSIKPAGGSSSSFAVGNPTLSGQTVTWASLGRNVAPGDVLTLNFTGQPGLELGSFTIEQASLKDGGSTFVKGLDHPVAPVRVVESMEPNSTPTTPTAVQPDTLYISHLSTSLDKDYFSVPVPPKGTIVSVRLSHVPVPADYDLSVYFPANLAPAEPSLRPGVAPSSRPFSSLPEDKSSTRNLGGTAATDQHDDIDTHACPPGVNAGPTCANLPLAGVSQNRQSPNAVLGEGTNETVEFVSPGGAGTILIEVAGYSGASSNHPYGLRVHNAAPPADVVGSPRQASFSYALSGTPAAIPASTKTLFVSAPSRLTALYGLTASQGVTTAINAVINDATVGPIVGGKLLNVDADSAVQAAYRAWDQNPYSAALADDVVRAINSLIDRQLPPASNKLQNVVVVGSDEVIPFGRVFEADVAANERYFAAELAAQIGGANAIVGSMASGHILTDDALVGTPIQLPGRFIYTSPIAHGRLVEKADEIRGSLDRFRLFGGKVDPRTALTTGYDFMSDEATAVNNVLAGKLGATNAKALISETWTKQALVSAYTLASPVPDIVSINGHSDAARTLPPAETTTSGLFTTQDLLGKALSNLLIFTMGCHSGLSLADVLVSAPSNAQKAALADWAQTNGAQGAAGFVGQTGYGVGSSSAIAYSEELMVGFAQKLGTMSLGEALAVEKSEYFANTTTFDAVHEKTMMQATYFGMPNFTFKTPTVTTAATAATATTVDPTTGLTVASIHTDSTFHKNTTSQGTYYDVNGDSLSAFKRPRQPRVRVDVTLPGKTAHGAAITGMVSVENPDNPPNEFDPVMESARPAGFAQQNEREPQTGDMVFPAANQGVATVTTPSGLRDQLTLVPGRFTSCALTDPGCATLSRQKTLGNQRLYPSIDTTVYYSTCSSFTPPTFDVALGALNNSTAFFSAHVTAAGSATVKRVLVMYHDSSGWKKLDLNSSNGSTWTGSAAVSGPQPEFFMEAVDSCGNVGVTTNKGSLFQLLPLSPSAISFGLPAAPASGWYTGPVTVTISGANQITYILDGVTYSYQGPFTVSGDGMHVVTAQGWDSAGNPVSGSIDVPIDSTPAYATITSPASGTPYAPGQVVYAEFACFDATSGVKSCVGTVANGARIDTTPGQHSFQVTTTDVAGNSATYTVTYGVSYQFIGFLNGVSNDSMNAANAGRTIPMKWQLKDAAGNYISSLSVVKSTTSYRIDCGTGEPITALPASATTTKTGLSYDTSSNQFNYGWVTETGWIATCRRFALVLDDSSVHTADFKFT